MSAENGRLMSGRTNTYRVDAQHRTQELSDTHVLINKVNVCSGRSADNRVRDASDRSFDERVGRFATWLASEEDISVRGALIRPVGPPHADKHEIQPTRQTDVGKEAVCFACMRRF